MNREERERMVDRLLNEALASQVVEPRAGLQERILTNLRAQPERCWWRWMWVPAAAVAAVLLVVTMRPTQPAQPTKTPRAAQQPPAPRAAEPVPMPSVAATHRKPVRARSAPRVIAVEKPEAASPRQRVFAPAGLTEAERALIAMLQTRPDEAKALMQQQEQARQEAAEFMEQAMAPRP